VTSASSSSSQLGQRTVYAGALLMAAVMAALAALLVIVLLTGPALTVALSDLAQGPERALAHAQLLSELLAGPALCAALAALGMWRLIWVVRVTRYMRFLRTYCQDRLRRDAPLLSMGLPPTGALLDAATNPDAAQTPRPIAELLAAYPQALLLGAVGAGKSTALLTFAQALSGRSVVARVLLGVRSESLPLLVSLPGLARWLGDAAPNPTRYVAELLARLGTNGLGARAEKLLRVGRITLLCDDYDKLDDDERDIINQALQRLREPPYSACRVVVACESAAYASVVDDLGPLAQFSAIEVAPIPIAELTRGLRKRQGRRQRAQEQRGAAVGPLVGDMHDRPLGVSLPTAAVAAALTETLAAGERVAWGRATLMRAYLQLASASAAVRDLESAVSQDTVEESQQPALVWAALAASLQEARSGYVPLDPTRTAGECALEWLITYPPPGPTDFALSVAPELPLRRIERDIQVGLRTGMLRRSLDGLTLSFAHRLAQVSAAAWWLDLRDDGLGRLNSHLLRSHWAAPVAFWAGAQDNPYDLAQRVFRFANSPDSIAPRAGMADSLDVYPQALALALVAVLEGTAPQLAHMISRQETQAHSFIQAQQGLRDLLDAAVIYGADATRRRRLTRALGRGQQEVGREFVLYLGLLAREANLDRLLRAQMTITLGLTATPEAISELMTLLTQADPTMRQAVDQALVYADAEAIPALQAEARGANPQMRRRAEEALRLLTGIASAAGSAGEAAGGAALAALNSPDAAQRRVAVTTLSAIGASEALNDLIARLDDVNGEVRLAAATALGQLGGKRALLALRKRATSSDTLLRLAVAQALGMDPAAASAPALIRLLKDRDARVRAAAATSLGAIADKRAAGPLREAAEDADPWVRHAAQTAVRRYTHA
jgi:HEAT repeat protein